MFNRGLQQCGRFFLRNNAKPYNSLKAGNPTVALPLSVIYDSSLTQNLPSVTIMQHI